MKYTFTLICFVFLPAWVFSQGGAYLVQGQLAIQKIPEWAYLVPDSELPQQIDSVEIKDGYFEFRGELMRPLKARIFTGKNYRQATKSFCLYLYLEPDTVLVSSPDTLRHAQVAGGPENQCYSELRVSLMQADSKLRSFAGAYLGIPAFYEDRSPGSDKGVLPDVLFRQAESLHWSVTRQFVKKYPDRWVSLDALIESVRGNREASQAAAVFNQLSASIRNSLEAEKYLTGLNGIKGP